MRWHLKQMARALTFRAPRMVTRVRLCRDFQGVCSFPVCPRCGASLEREYLSYCSRCGQCLCWDRFDQAAPLPPGVPGPGRRARWSAPLALGRKHR